MKCDKVSLPNYSFTYTFALTVQITRVQPEVRVEGAGAEQREVRQGISTVLSLYKRFKQL